MMLLLWCVFFFFHVTIWTFSKQNSGGVAHLLLVTGRFLVNKEKKRKKSRLDVNMWFYNPIQYFINDCSKKKQGNQIWATTFYCEPSFINPSAKSRPDTLSSDYPLVLVLTEFFC